MGRGRETMSAAQTAAPVGLIPVPEHFDPAMMAARPGSPFTKNGSLAVKAVWPEQKAIRPPSRQGFRPRSSYRRKPTAEALLADLSGDEQLQVNLRNALEETVLLRPANPVKTLALMLFESQGIKIHQIKGTAEEAEALAA